MKLGPTDQRIKEKFQKFFGKKAGNTVFKASGKIDVIKSEKGGAKTK